jgi:hypothetical protein
MPPSIDNFHILFTILAFGVLISVGATLAYRAITWPQNRLTSSAGLLCVLILLIAWFI